MQELVDAYLRKVCLDMMGLSGKKVALAEFVGDVLTGAQDFVDGAAQLVSKYLCSEAMQRMLFRAAVVLGTHGALLCPFQNVWSITPAVLGLEVLGVLGQPAQRQLGKLPPGACLTHHLDMDHGMTVEEAQALWRVLSLPYHVMRSAEAGMARLVGGAMYNLGDMLKALGTSIRALCGPDGEFSLTTMAIPRAPPECAESWWLPLEGWLEKARCLGTYGNPVYKRWVHRGRPAVPVGTASLAVAFQVLESATEEMWVRFQAAHSKGPTTVVVLMPVRDHNMATHRPPFSTSFMTLAQGRRLVFKRVSCPQELRAVLDSATDVSHVWCTFHGSDTAISMDRDSHVLWPPWAFGMSWPLERFSPNSTIVLESCRTGRGFAQRLHAVLRGRVTLLAPRDSIPRSLTRVSNQGAVRFFSASHRDVTVTLAAGKEPPLRSAVFLHERDMLDDDAMVDMDIVMGIHADGGVRDRGAVSSEVVSDGHAPDVLTGHTDAAEVFPDMVMRDRLDTLAREQFSSSLAQLVTRVCPWVPAQLAAHGWAHWEQAHQQNPQAAAFGWVLTARHLFASQGPSVYCTPAVPSPTQVQGCAQDLHVRLQHVHAESTHGMTQVLDQLDLCMGRVLAGRQRFSSAVQQSRSVIQQACASLQEVFKDPQCSVDAWGFRGRSLKSIDPSAAVSVRALRRQAADFECFFDRASREELEQWLPAYIDTVRGLQAAGASYDLARQARVHIQEPCERSAWWPCPRIQSLLQTLQAVM